MKNKMNLMNSGLLVGSLVSVLAMASPAIAQDATVTPAPAANAPATNAEVDANAKVGVSAVDAGKLIGEDVVDAKGDTVGEIESVIVDTNGKVTSVVLDVSGWLEAEKRISVPWSDLKSDADGNIQSSMTKENAQAAADYSYSDDVNRGKVLNESGQVYADNGTQQPATGAATTTESSMNASRTVDIPAQNADGSFNASKVVGVNVVNNANEGIGEIGEVLIDKSGKASGVVIDVGGFLGLGSHPVKLGWDQVKLVTQDGELKAMVDMDKDALKKMPAYDANKS